MEQTSRLALFSASLAFLCLFSSVRASTRAYAAADEADLMVHATGGARRSLLTEDPRAELTRIEGLIKEAEAKLADGMLQISKVEAEETDLYAKAEHFRLLQLVLNSSSMLPEVSVVSKGTLATRYDDDELEPGENFLRFVPSTALLQCSKGHVVPTARPASRPPFSWVPQEGKYLLATCFQGHILHRDLCIRKYVGLAALLNRTLLLPAADVHPTFQTKFDPDWVLDLEQLKKCFQQEKLVVKMEDYLKETGAATAKTTFSCWGLPDCGLPNICGSGEPVAGIEKIGECKQAPLLWPYVHDFKFVEVYGKAVDPILSMGDLSKANGIFEYPHLFAGGVQGHFQLLPDCEFLVRPAKPILEAAFKFLRYLIGVEYAAVYFRRADFLASCPGREGECAQTMHQFATAIVTEMSQAPKPLSLIFMATDARPGELLLLEQHFRAVSPRPIQLTTLLSMTNVTWAASMQGFETEPHAVALLEEVICSMGPMFLSFRPTLFSTSVMRMRVALNTTSCLDNTNLGARVH